MVKVTGGFFIAVTMACLHMNKPQGKYFTLKMLPKSSKPPAVLILSLDMLSKGFRAPGIRA